MARRTDGGERGGDEVHRMNEIPVVKRRSVLPDDNSLIVAFNDSLHQRQQFRLVHASVVICVHLVRQRCKRFNTAVSRAVPYRSLSSIFNSILHTNWLQLLGLYRKISRINHFYAAKIRNNDWHWHISRLCTYDESVSIQLLAKINTSYNTGLPHRPPKFKNITT